MIEWNNKTKRIVQVVPGTLRYLLYHDAPNELAGFLAAGWKEIYREVKEGSYEQLEVMRAMYRKKLSKIPKVSKRVKRVPVPEEETDK